MADPRYITRLTVTNFRSYPRARLRLPYPSPVVIYGPNGAGKTNLLEAVSYLAPGRGLRKGSLEDIKRDTAGINDGWSVAARINTRHGQVDLSTGIDGNDTRPRRHIRIDGQERSSQSDLADHIQVSWLTPQMDDLFIGSKGNRRRFLDRMIYAYDPAHSGRRSRYSKAMYRRSKLLQDGVRDDAWLSSLESQMAETGVAIAAARLDFVRRLDEAWDTASDQKTAPFPTPAIDITGTVEGYLRELPALAAEDKIKKNLKTARSSDAQSGGADIGPHKSDLIVHHARKGRPADQCSTGEQKALLIGLILADLRVAVAQTGQAPVLLLDEVAAHLDAKRRAALFDILLDLGCQTWLTGTDLGLFDPIKDQSNVLRIKPGKIIQESMGG